MFHLSDRELFLLGEPTRQQTLHVVGWMVLANAFGQVCDEPVNYGEELPSRTFRNWVGSLSVTAKRRDKRRFRAATQSIPANRRRRVRVRKTRHELATGKH